MPEVLIYAFELNSINRFILRVYVRSRTLRRCYHESHDYHSDQRTFPSSFPCRGGAPPFLNYIVLVLCSVLVVVVVFLLLGPKGFLFKTCLSVWAPLMVPSVLYMCFVALVGIRVLSVPIALALIEAWALTLAWFCVIL